VSNLDESGDKPMNYAEAARWLGWRESTLRERTNAGSVPHARVGRNVMFIPSVLREWLIDESLASFHHKPARTDTVVRRQRRQHP
jgi:hypothetical protein